MTRTLLYFLIFLFLADGLSKADSRSSKENYYREGRSYKGGQQKGSKVETNQKNASAPTGKSSGGGLGAWGYMAIILTLSGIGIGIYYFTLFYPILCKKERKYDVMELSSLWRNVNVYCVCGYYLCSVMVKMLKCLNFEICLIVLHYRFLFNWQKLHYFINFLPFMFMLEIHKMLTHSTLMYVVFVQNINLLL